MTDLTRAMLRYGDATLTRHREETLECMLFFYGIHRWDFGRAAGTEPINLARTAAAWTGGDHALAVYGYALTQRGRAWVFDESRGFGNFWSSTGFSPVIPAAGKFDAMTAHHWPLTDRWGNGYDHKVLELEFEAAVELHRRGVDTDRAAKLAVTGEARNYLRHAEDGVAIEYLDISFGGADA